MFNTIHIFGFGTTQFISAEKNKSVESVTLTKEQAFIDHVKTFVPADVTLTDHHVIHVFNDTTVRYLGKSSTRDAANSFSVKISQLDSTILNDFVNELEAAINALPEE